MRIWAAVLFWLVAWPLAAQEVPALFDVTGVAADDVLNVRAGPEASAEVMGTLPPGTRGVEVVALNDSGRWGQVNLGEAAGWVSMAFLRPQFPGKAALPAAFTCFGTEPFWRLDVVQEGESFLATPMEDPQGFATGGLITAAGRSGVYALAGEGASLVLRRGMCSDGMSDRSYGLSVELLTQSPEALYSGCCTLAR